jgi:hypothetical protein
MSISYKETKMLSSLTDEQLQKLPKYIRKWKRIALSTSHTDEKIIKDTINRIYRYSKLQEPTQITIVDSPLGFMRKDFHNEPPVWTHILNNDRSLPTDIGWNVLWESVNAQISPTIMNILTKHLDVPLTSDLNWDLQKQLNEQTSHRKITCLTLCDFVYNNLTIFYDYCIHVLNLKLPQLDYIPDAPTCLQDIIKGVQHLHLFIPCKDLCIVSRKPLVYKFDVDGKLHNENGFSVMYPDGFSMCHIHGKQVQLLNLIYRRMGLSTTLPTPFWPSLSRMWKDFELEGKINKNFNAALSSMILQISYRTKQPIENVFAVIYDRFEEEGGLV